MDKEQYLAQWHNHPWFRYQGTLAETEEEMFYFDPRYLHLLTEEMLDAMKQSSQFGCEFVTELTYMDLTDLKQKNVPNSYPIKYRWK